MGASGLFGLLARGRTSDGLYGAVGRPRNYWFPGGHQACSMFSTSMNVCLGHPPLQSPSESTCRTKARPTNVAFFVRALASTCQRRAAPLALVRLDPELGERLVRSVEREPLEGPEVRVELFEGLGASVEVYRRP